MSTGQIQRGSCDRSNPPCSLIIRKRSHKILYSKVNTSQILEENTLYSSEYQQCVCITKYEIKQKYYLKGMLRLHTYFDTAKIYIILVFRSQKKQGTTNLLLKRPINISISFSLMKICSKEENYIEKSYNNKVDLGMWGTR